MVPSPRRCRPDASGCDASRVQITGHRGQVLTGGAIENTVAAVDAALSAGVDGVEVDVRLALDDRLLEIAGVAWVIGDRPAGVRADIMQPVRATVVA